MTLTFRAIKGSGLTNAEIDGNFTDLNGRVTTAQATATSAASAASAAQASASGAASAASAAQSAASAAAAAAAASSQPGHTHSGLAPAGGLTGYVLKKIDGTDFNYTWQPDNGGVGGGGDALVALPLSQFAATTSAQLRTVISDETGTGALVFASGPTLVNPVVGTQAPGNNSTLAASTAYADAAVTAAIATLRGAAPAALDTFLEVAQSLANNTDAFTTLNNLIAAKQAGSAALTFVAGAVTADAAGLRALLSLGSAALSNTTAFAAASHAHTLVEMTASVTAATALEREAFNAALLSSIDTAINTSRALAPATDDNRSGVVAASVVVTLNTGGLTDGATREMLEATAGATFSLTVGTATLKNRLGGVTLTGSIPSSQSANGRIVVSNRGGTFVLDEPVIPDLTTTITASANLPTQTAEEVQYLSADPTAGSITLTVPVSAFLARTANRKPRKVLIQVVGTGTNTVSVSGAGMSGTASATPGQAIVMISGIADNAPMVKAG